MQTNFFTFSLVALTTILGAAPALAATPVEVIERDGVTVVREVFHAEDKRACTNCKHVGDSCVIGEGNCYSSEKASCTVCGDRTICVSNLGNCQFP